SRAPSVSRQATATAATTSAPRFDVALDLARVEPRQVLVELVHHQLLDFLVQLPAQDAQEFRRRDKVELVVAVRVARLVEVLADALREKLGLVLVRRGLLAVASRPARGAAARLADAAMPAEPRGDVGDELLVLGAARGVHQVL